MKGCSTSSDQWKGFALIKEAAEKDDPDALVELGKCYLEGCGVSKSDYTSTSYFQKAADLGSTNALDWLKSCKEKNVADYWLLIVFKGFESTRKGS